MFPVILRQSETWVVGSSNISVVVDIEPNYFTLIRQGLEPRLHRVPMNHAGAPLWTPIPR